MAGGKITRIAGGTFTQRCKNLTYYQDNFTINAGGKISLTCDGEMTFGEPDPFPPHGLMAKCIVHFRPNANWQGEYGFDWMRVGDTELKGDNPYQDIIIEKEVTGKYEGLTAYERLKKVYGDGFTDYAYNIPWRTHKDEKTNEEVAEEYFAPWLVLFPEQIKDKQSGEWVDSGYANTQAELSLIVEVEEDASGYALKYDEDLLEASYDEIPATKGNYKNIGFRVKCLREFSKTQEIKIYAIDNSVAKIKRLAGVLRVMPNDIVYKPKVVLVRVKTELVVNEITEGEATNDAVAVIKKHLRQALIEPQIEWANLDVLSQNYHDTFSNQTLSRRNYFKGRNTIGSKINVNSGNIHGDLDVFLQFDAPRGINYTKYFKVYYIDEGEDGLREEDKGYAGFSTMQVDARSSIVLRQGFGDMTAVHELIHSMGLRHPFDIKSTHTFKQHHTDNIMDYEQTKPLMPGMSFKQIPTIQLWKWQIDYIRECFINDKFEIMP